MTFPRYVPDPAGVGRHAVMPEHHYADQVQLRLGDVGVDHARFEVVESKKGTDHYLPRRNDSEAIAHRGLGRPHSGERLDRRHHPRAAFRAMARENMLSCRGVERPPRRRADPAQPGEGHSPRADINVRPRYKHSRLLFPWRRRCLPAKRFSSPGMCANSAGSRVFGWRTGTEAHPRKHPFSSSRPCLTPARAKCYLGPRVAKIDLSPFFFLDSIDFYPLLMSSGNGLRTIHYEGTGVSARAISRKSRAGGVQRYYCTNRERIRA